MSFLPWPRSAKYRQNNRNSYGKNKYFQTKINVEQTNLLLKRKKCGQQNKCKLTKLNYGQK